MFKKYEKVICISLAVVLGVVVALCLHNMQSAKSQNAIEPVVRTESESLVPTKAPAEQISITIRCDTVLNNMESLKPEKQGLIPADGILLAVDNVDFSAGETFFDVSKRITKENKLHFVFSESIQYGAYIEGIGNLYAQDCGELSGWLCRVNGEMLSVGCSQYELMPGDKIEWVYTCDGGADLEALI